MRLDHVSYAVGYDGLARTADRLAKLLGASFVNGGIHPRFGTRNMVLPMSGHQYLELVEVLDHPASDKAPFGQAVRARSEAGGGWLGWVVAVDDIAIVEKRLERESVPGNRYRPDGVELRWLQVGVQGLRSDPQLPFFIEWKSDPWLHPAAHGDGSVTLTSLDIAGDPSRVADWLDASPNHVAEHVEINWVEPLGSPGLVAATFMTRTGEVRI
jgi:hypothetical protein